MSDEENNTKDEKTPSPALSDEVKDFIVRTVNAAAGTRVGKLEKKMEDMFAGLTDTITSASAKTEAPKTEDAGKPDKALQTQIQQLQARLDEERNLRVQTEKQHIEKNTKDKLRDALARGGVPNERMNAAIALLYTEEKRVKRDDDGNVYFFEREKGVTELIARDLDDGIGRFLNSDEGKFFLPAKEVQGSGNKGGKAPGVKEPKESTVDLLSQLGNMMMHGQS